ncbi:hypothetical protein [Cohnella yongneupensis]|uniref:Flagellin Flp1-like domain-containing protein n=1 Tax=Cohnella yongneupensis TaxID=425006 RepID=A0ABW0QUL8_9BACL
MKVMINGRELQERMESLGQREQSYFEVIKTAAIFIAGALLIICLPGVVDAIADVLDRFGPHIVHAYRAIR